MRLIPHTNNKIEFLVDARPSVRTGLSELSPCLNHITNVRLLFELCKRFEKYFSIKVLIFK